MTKSQQKVLNAYIEYINKNGVIPTYKELSNILSINPSAIHTHIRNLRLQGLIPELKINTTFIEVPTFIAEILNDGIKKIILELKKK